jgi:putative oxidoreductase
LPAAEAVMQKQAFNKNLGVVGGLLLLGAFGAGALSVDGRRRHAA